MELPNRRHPSVTLADGIKLSFDNKSGNAMAWQDNCLLIESLAGTTDGAYVSLSHDGNDLTDIVYTAFINTQWWNNRKDNNVVNYIGRMVYKAGSGITGDVTIADGTIG